MGGNTCGRETRGVENVLRGLREAVLRGGAGGVSAGRVLVVEPPVVGAPLHGITRRAALVMVVGQRHGQQHEKCHYQRVICKGAGLHTRRRFPLFVSSLVVYAAKIA